MIINSKLEISQIYFLFLVSIMNCCGDEGSDLSLRPDSQINLRGGAVMIYAPAFADGHCPIACRIECLFRSRGNPAAGKAGFQG